MLNKSITGNFAILDHRTLRETHLIGETDDTYAIFNIVTTEHPEGIWSKAEHLLEHSTIGYSIIERYLNGTNAEGNIHYQTTTSV
jgi:hypothetical protein